MNAIVYLPEAVTSAVAVIECFVSRPLADLIACVLRESSEEGTPALALSPTAFEAYRSALNDADPETATALLFADAHAFRDAFGFALFDRFHAEAPVLPAFTPSFRAVLAKPLPGAQASRIALVDGATALWINALPAALAASAGHHFVFRTAPGGPDAQDLVALVAASAPVEARLSFGRPLPVVLFAAELHVGASRPLIVVVDDLLAVPAADGARSYPESPTRAALDLDDAARRALGVFSRLQAVYVWHVPGPGSLPPALDGIVAGCIGPLSFDRTACAAVLALQTPWLRPSGLAALQAIVEDPRKTAPALAAIAAVAEGNDMSLDEAALLVARSHGAKPTPLVRPAPFDPTLVSADEDIVELIDRAAALAENGARFLLVGPPAAGKSVFGLHLCRAMLEACPGSGAARDVVVVVAADILATNWGATERQLRNKFLDAAASDAPMLVDEFDAFAGVREQGGVTSNNGHLTRALTDQWLRDLDAFAGVPVVATCNDALSIDPAVRRRFHFVITFRGELDPDRERRAWRLIAGLEPDEDWRPVGAALGDIAAAAARCRLLGRKRPSDLADAILRARDARLGPLASPRSTRSVH